jgi:hypothetical protein
MAQLVQVTQSQFGGPPVVEEDVSDASNFAMPRNSNDGNGQCVVKRSVNGNDAFGAASYELARILFDHVGFVPVVGAEIKVAFTHEVIADPAHDQRVIAIAQFRDEHADCERPLFAERAREQTWLVVEFPGSGANSLAGFGGDGAPWDIVEHHGNCGRAEAEIVSKNLQADRLIGGQLVILPEGHS